VIRPPHTRSLLRLGVSLVVVAALGGCGGGGGSPKAASKTDSSQSGSLTGGATAHVNLPQSYKFSPAAITVKAGTTVVWTNHDNFPHNVTLLDGPKTSKDVSIGKSVQIAFATPGTYRYQCAFHPAQMKGTVTVTS
jgi:plastocyanin